MQTSKIDLCSEHQQLFSAYSKYFKNSQLLSLKEVQKDFEDLKEEHDDDSEIFSYEELLNIIDNISDTISSRIKKEFEKYSNTNMLFVKQLLLCAEANSTTLNIDISMLDDETMQTQFNVDNIKHNSLFPISKHSLTPLAPLAPLVPLDNKVNPVDLNLLSKNKELENEKKNVLSRFEKLQQQFLKSQKELKNTENKLEEITIENLRLNKHISSSSHDVDQFTSNLTEQTEKIKTLEEKIIYLEQENQEKDTKLTQSTEALLETEKKIDTKINTSQQFQQLKSLLQEKNSLLKDARNEIQKLKMELEEKKPESDDDD